MKRSDAIPMILALAVVYCAGAVSAASVTFEQELAGVETLVKRPGFPGVIPQPGHSGHVNPVHPQPVHPPHPQPQPWHPQPPMPYPPQPQPWQPPVPYPPQPQPQPVYGDLYGYCQDLDHRQFTAAKDFAYSGTGLDYSAPDATGWALNYNRTHACGTIQEYAARYLALYDYAYSGSYMNMGRADARSYALRYADHMTVPRIQEWKRTFLAVYELFYSGSYLSGLERSSRERSQSWNERGYCGDVLAVGRLKDEYYRQFQFAHSFSGLNYGVGAAKEYALGSLRRMTPCGDLLK